MEVRTVMDRKESSDSKQRKSLAQLVVASIGWSLVGLFAVLVFAFGIYTYHPLYQNPDFLLTTLQEFMPLILAGILWVMIVAVIIARSIRYKRSGRLYSLEIRSLAQLVTTSFGWALVALFACWVFALGIYEYHPLYGKTYYSGTTLRQDFMPLILAGVLWVIIIAVIVICSIRYARRNERSRARRSVRRLLIISGVFALAVGIYHYNLTRRIDRRLNDIRSAERPATLAELDKYYTKPPPGENAAAVVIEAFSHYVTLEKEKEDLVPVVGMALLPKRTEPLPKEMEEAIAQYLQDNSKAIDLLHQAAAMKKCRYPGDPSTGDEGSAELISHFSGIRQAARLLSLETIFQAEKGKSDLAARSVISALHLWDGLGQIPMVLAQLVRNACLAITVSSCEHLLTRCELTEGQLVQLSRAFRDAEDLWVMTRALLGERCLGSNLFNRKLGWISTWYQKPERDIRFLLYRGSGLLQIDHLYYLDFMADYIKASSLPLNERLKTAKNFEKRVETLASFRNYPRLLLGSVPRELVCDAERVALTRTVLVALAVEQYRLAMGKLPQKLSDLVPSFLDSVPLDPFDGNSLRYKMLERGYIVYSIGQDGQDNGGAEQSTVSERPYDITFSVER